MSSRLSITFDIFSLSSVLRILIKSLILLSIFFSFSVLFLVFSPIFETSTLPLVIDLNSKSLIEQASLANMKVENSEATAGNNNKKGFVINCKLKAT